MASKKRTQQSNVQGTNKMTTEDTTVDTSVDTASNESENTTDTTNNGDVVDSNETTSNENTDAGSEDQGSDVSTETKTEETPNAPDVTLTTEPQQAMEGEAEDVISEETESIDPNKEKLDSYGVTSVTALVALQTIDDYISKMGPNIPVNEEEGARNQVTLYRAIISLINGSHEDFNAAFLALLNKFNEHKDTVFNELSIYRFYEAMMLPKTERDSFQRLINMLLLTADPKSRLIGIKQINFEPTLSGLTAEGRQNVMNFFNV